MIGRRAALRLGLLAGGALALAGHTPYGHWEVYRQKHLLIGCHRGDLRTYDLARRIVDALNAHLPDASARVARAPHARRLASLIGTEQLAVAVLAADEARAMAAGRGRFAPYGEIPLRLLAPIGDRLLLAHAGFPARHAALVSGAIMDDWQTRRPAPDAPTALPWHGGTAAFLRGDPLPAPAAGE